MECAIFSHSLFCVYLDISQRNIFEIQFLVLILIVVRMGAQALRDNLNSTGELSSSGGVNFMIPNIDNEWTC